MEANHAGYIDCGSAELADGARNVIEPDADGLRHMDVLPIFSSYGAEIKAYIREWGGPMK